MKRLLILTAALAVCASAAFAADAEGTAKTLLNAYKAHDVKTVKANVSGMIVNAVSPKYFEEGSIKEFIKDLKKWDGKIREVRYSGSAFGTMAAVYYDESPRKGRIRVISLSKAKGKDARWVQFANGFEHMKKEEFEQDYSAQLPKPRKGPRAKGPAAKGGKAGVKKPAFPRSSYSLETADGTAVKAPSDAQLKKAFGSLNEDNFYLTLNNPSGFMQGSYMESGMDMQYKDKAGHFTCKKVVPSDKALEMFTGYLNGGTEWKKCCEWGPME